MNNYYNKFKGYFTKMTEEKNGKKLIRVKTPKILKNPYGASSFNFAFASAPENGRIQCTEITTCRETLCSFVRRALFRVDSDEVSKNYKEIFSKFDPNKLRLLILFDKEKHAVEEFKNRLFSGKKALNLLEEIAGFSNSTITTVISDNYKNAWLLTGSKEWFSQPQLLSLATFILRFASRYGELNTNSFEDLIKHIKSIVKHKKEQHKVTDDIRYAEVYADKIELLLSNLDIIFKDMTLKNAWSDNKGNYDFYRGCGIMSFAGLDKDVLYSKKVEKARKIFLNLCKENNV